MHNLSDKSWTEHVEYLLGEEVLKLTAKDDMGNVIGKLSWRAFLQFEWEALHRILSEANHGRHTVATAIRAVRGGPAPAHEVL